MKMILASNNAHKVREFGEILAESGIELISQRDAGCDFEVDETGDTFEENAFLKADAVMRGLTSPYAASPVMTGQGRLRGDLGDGRYNWDADWEGNGVRLGGQIDGALGTLATSTEGTFKISTTKFSVSRINISTSPYQGYCLSNQARSCASSSLMSMMLLMAPR